MTPEFERVKPEFERVRPVEPEFERVKPEFERVRPPIPERAPPPERIDPSVVDPIRRPKIER